MKFALTTSLLAENKQIQEADNLIIKALNKRGIENHLVNPTSYETILNANSVEIYSNNELISDADILLVKRTRNAEQVIYELAKAMETTGVISIDNADSLIYPPAKLIPHLYRVGNIKFPKSGFLQKADKKAFKFAQQMGLKTPFIVKPQYGTKGQGVELINNLESMINYAQKYPETPIIIQEKIDIYKEYRVMIVGDKSLGACLKKSNNLVKNAAQGAEFHYLRDKTIEDFAKKATINQPGDIFGVDIAQSKDNQLYVIESNRNPNFIAFREASNIQVEEKIIDYAISRLSNKDISLYRQRKKIRSLKQQPFNQKVF